MNSFGQFFPWNSFQAKWLAIFELFVLFFFVWFLLYIHVRACVRACACVRVCVDLNMIQICVSYQLHIHFWALGILFLCDFIVYLVQFTRLEGKSETSTPWYSLQDRGMNVFGEVWVLSAWIVLRWVHIIPLNFTIEQVWLDFLMFWWKLWLVWKNIVHPTPDLKKVAVLQSHVNNLPPMIRERWKKFRGSSGTIEI